MNIEPGDDTDDDSNDHSDDQIASADDLPGKFPGRKTRPIPPAFKHISVNGCKTPGCENFGVAPREGKVIKGPGAREKATVMS